MTGNVPLFVAAFERRAKMSEEACFVSSRVSCFRMSFPEILNLNSLTGEGKQDVARNGPVDDHSEEGTVKTKPFIRDSCCSFILENVSAPSFHLFLQGSDEGIDMGDGSNCVNEADQLRLSSKRSKIDQCLHDLFTKLQAKKFRPSWISLCLCGTKTCEKSVATISLTMESKDNHASKQALHPQTGAATRRSWTLRAP